MSPESQFNNKYPEIVMQSEAASRQSCSKALLAELFADLQRIDETSILPDGDWVSVCVSTWAAEWVERMRDAGLIPANDSVTGAAKPRTVDAVLDISCTEPCVLGDLGHCGRTDRERWSHCEKRFNAGLPQLSNKTEEQ